MKEKSNINKDPFGDFNGTHASSKSGDRTFSRILQEIVNHLTEIIRSELQLARTEVSQDLAQVLKASVFFLIGAVFALYALGFILIAVVFGLGTMMSLWLSALIVGVGMGLTAAIFLQVGTTKIRRADLKPNETIESLQENIAWTKKQIG